VPYVVNCPLLHVDQIVPTSHPFQLMLLPLSLSLSPSHSLATFLAAKCKFNEGAAKGNNKQQQQKYLAKLFTSKAAQLRLLKEQSKRDY